MKKTMIALAAIAAFSTVLAAQSTTQSTQTPTPAKPEAAKSKIMTDVQGVWVFTIVDGNDMTGQSEIIITVTDNKYVQTIDGNVVERGTFKIDDTKKPIQLDLFVAEGQDAGKTQLGVLELTATTMKGKLNTAGETTRPTDFAPAPADGYFTFTASKRK